MFTPSQLIDQIDKHISLLPFDETPGGLYDPIRYVMQLGGKRIRPVLMLMAYNLYQDSVEEILDPAIGLEIYHNFTLLHDDLMDRADKRRGKDTVHKVWGDNTAILSGDAMLILAYRYISMAPADHLKDTLEVFTRAALEVCEGQQYDMEFERRQQVSEEEYETMIRLKTAVLLAAGLRIGTLLGGGSRQDADLMYDFGIYTGIAFQLKDDLLDVYGNPEVFGKNIGGDIVCHKKTYLLIKALERADAFQRESLQHWMKKECDPQIKIEAVTKLYNELHVRQVCEERIDKLYQEALSCLERVGVSSERKEELRGLVKQLMDREL
ncbi:MAG: polyprenyl synthetase family protein [Bacteroides sp.]|nr:polyprenyl synthetase family protein [Bacteroides sp.]